MRLFIFYTAVLSFTALSAFAQEKGAIIRRTDKTLIDNITKGVTITDKAHQKNQVFISGEVTGKTMENDSIHFQPGMINKKYFEKPFLSSKIEDNKFHVKAEVSYPQMYRIVFESDKNKIPIRTGSYFIDNSTDSIKVDYSYMECNEVNGRTSDEFQNKFIPFFFAEKGGYDCKPNQLAKLIHDESSAFDATLSNYVTENPDSYVALWHLIERFSLFGHSKLREKMLGQFSDKIKAGRPWTILNNDIKNAGIKEDGVFPVFNVKTDQLEEQKLSLPKAQYTLVDFWFSRCRPCLEALPTLKELYATYQLKGFEIVSISTDRTEEVPLWHKRIKEYGLPWLQYLDEDAIESEKLLVRTFPATFLLNQKGEIIKKDISPEELEKFLEEHLRK